MPACFLRIFLIILVAIAGKPAIAADSARCNQYYAIDNAIAQDRYHFEIVDLHGKNKDAYRLDITVTGSAAGKNSFNLTKTRNEDSSEVLKLADADQKKMGALLQPVYDQYTRMSDDVVNDNGIADINSFVNAIHIKYQDKADIIRLQPAGKDNMLLYILGGLVLVLAGIIAWMKIKSSSGAGPITKSLPVQENREEKTGEAAVPQEIPAPDAAQPAAGNLSINDTIALQNKGAQVKKERTSPRLKDETAKRQEAEKLAESLRRSIEESEDELKKMTQLKDGLQQEINRLLADKKLQQAHTDALLAYTEKARTALIVPFLQFSQSSALVSGDEQAYGLLLRDVFTMAWQYMALVNYLPDRNESSSHRLNNDDRYNLELYGLQSDLLRGATQPVPVRMDHMPADKPALVRSIAAMLHRYGVKDLPVAIAGVLFSQK